MRNISSISPLRQPSASPQATITTEASSTLAWLKLAERSRRRCSGVRTTMKRQGCMLYPLGARRPASRIFLRSSLGMGAPSKEGVALRCAIAWLSVFSIRLAIRKAFPFRGTCSVRSVGMAARLRDLVHGQFNRILVLIIAMRVDPESVKCLPELGVLRKHGLHQLDDLSMRGNRVGDILGLVVDHQVQPTGEVVRSHAGDVKALASRFHNQRVEAGKLQRPHGLRFFLQLLEIRAGEKI